MALQTEKGSPVKPGLQVQTGLCLFTVHVDSTPQETIQGSEHFSLIHARFGGHSEL